MSGPLIVAIGDVHGEAGLLRATLDALPAIETHRGRPLVVYLLGDLVDRGPDSRGVLDLAVETLRARPGSKLLLGNHDEWFRRFLTEPGFDAEADVWLEQGGRETLRSYGFGTRDLPAIREAILREHPAHVALLEKASIIEFAGAFAFVHAGVDPSLPLDGQRPHDCVWIRAPFMNHVGRLSHVVVHGHTPQKRGSPVATENRLSMDTGAVFTGRLSAAIIDPEHGTVEFRIATRGGLVEHATAQRFDRGLGTFLDD